MVCVYGRLCVGVGAIHICWEESEIANHIEGDLHYLKCY